MVSANYLDGRSTRIRVVELSMLESELSVTGEDVKFCVPFANVNIDERLGRAARRLRFPDGSFCEVKDLAGLDALLAATLHRNSRVDRLQRNLTAVVISLAACIVLIVLGYKVVLPWAAARGAREMPPVVGRTLTTEALKALDGNFLLPSSLAPERQQVLRARFHQLRLPEGGTPRSELLFRRSSQLGANAFTLPDGTIVMLDGLVNLMQDDQQVMAVTAHELGHAHGRHGLQQLLRSTAIGAFWSLYVGDISQLLAAAPTAIMEARYSQDLEQEADDYGAALLLKNGSSPELLAEVLTELTKAHPGAGKGGYLASHPPSEQRIQRMHVLATGSHVAEEK